MCKTLQPIVSAWVLIPPSKPQPSNFFCPLPQALKNLISPSCRTCLTITLILISEQPMYILIPIYVIQVIWQNQNITKLNIHWLLGYNRPRLTFEIGLSKPYFIFIFKSFFDKKDSKLNLSSTSALSSSWYCCCLIVSKENPGYNLVKYHSNNHAMQYYFQRFLDYLRSNLIFLLG